MARYVIYTKAGGVRCEVHKLEYTGTVGEERAVKVTVSVAYPLSFSVGDYLVFRDEPFTIDMEAGVKKQSSSGTFGEGFVYELTFQSCHRELVNCRFLDYVRYGQDDELRYNPLPKYSFYAESATDLLDRVIANTDRLYGDGVWSYVLPEGGLPETDEENISVDNMSCWDALKLLNSTFDLRYYVKGRVIYVESDEETDWSFRYGRGNGLRSVERVTNGDANVVTRLRAYGNSTNMATDYYRRLWLPYLENFGMDLNLRQDLVTGKYLPSMDYFSVKVRANQALPSETLFSDEEDEIPVYLSSRLSGHDYSAYNVTVRIGAYGTLRDSYEFKGYVVFFHDVQYLTYATLYCFLDHAYGEYESPYAITGENNYGSYMQIAHFMEDDADVTDIYFSGGIFRDLFSGRRTIEFDPWLNVFNLMLPGFPYTSLAGYMGKTSDGGVRFSSDMTDFYIESVNADTLGVREGVVVFDNDESDDKLLSDIFPSLEKMSAGDIGVQVPSGYSDRLDEILGYGLKGGDPNDGSYIGYAENDRVIPNFTIKIKNIGFNIKDAVNGTSQPSISFTSGLLVGREFTIVKVEEKRTSAENILYYELECQRVYDEDIRTYFPYGDSSVGGYYFSVGDRFVLLNITMPDVYVDAASLRLFDAAKAWLEKHDHTVFSYRPKMDNIFLKDHPSYASQLVEGRRMVLAADSDIGLSEPLSVVIKTLSIKVGEKALEEYEVTLSDDEDDLFTARVSSGISSAMRLARRAERGLKLLKNKV